MGDSRRNSRDESTLPRYALRVTRYSLRVTRYSSSSSMAAAKIASTEAACDCGEFR